MKLSDIVIVEAAPDKGPVDIADVAQYFPNTYQKAARTLLNQGRLAFKGEPIFSYGHGGYSAPIEHLVSEAENRAKSEEFDLEIEIDGSLGDKDDGGNFTLSIHADDLQEVYLGYSAKSKKFYVGFDAWIDEHEFNEAWDREFEKIFGENFDPEEGDHEKIFNGAWKKFKNEQAFCGILVEVNEAGHATIDEQPAEKGFYRGIYNNATRSSVLKADKVIDLRLD